jgi:hypothetical protein
MLSFVVSASVDNAWILCRQSVNHANEKLDLLEFTRRILLIYLQRLPQKAGLKRLTQKKHVLPEVRLDRMDHVIESSQSQSRNAVGNAAKGGSTMLKISSSITF